MASKIDRQFFIPNKELVIAEELNVSNKFLTLKGYWKGRRGGGLPVIVKKLNPFNEKTFANLCEMVIPLLYNQHKNVLRVYGLSETSVVVEYIQGVSLFDTIQNDYFLMDEETKLNFAFQVISAINFLHNLSPPLLTHNLSSHSFILTKNSTVKLFSLFEENKVNAQPSEKYDQKSEIFRLGVVVYEIFERNSPVKKSGTAITDHDFAPHFSRSFTPSPSPLIPS
eukprot:TRINITY_DN10385_c0_g1_i1.p1 TRINITY_DN10385_c0_g1~~TRINITY_DN10385_c0_g1_i1.p1  ORF type:complete len:225 (-),score=50.23 TRINITY_DN10385_c0_g1_i1:264-938(-)